MFLFIAFITGKSNISDSQAPFELPDAVNDRLRCSRCTSYLSCTPIWCSADGDGICGRCMPDDDKTASLYRNSVYEKTVADVQFPCIYDKFGCPEKLEFGHVAVHERRCAFKRFICPSLSGECGWRGPVEEIWKHFRTHDMVLRNNTFAINTKRNVNNQNVIIKCEGDKLPIMVQYKYKSAKKMLFFDAVHFYCNNCAIKCHLKFVNEINHNLSAPYKSFGCKPFVSKHLNVAGAHKIDLNKYLYVLDNPKDLLVSVFCKYENVESFSLKSSPKECLDKIVCHDCCIYMVPPIVKNKNRLYCKNCNRDLPRVQLEEFCKKLYYPCKWANCKFVGDCDVIRRHEFQCNNATFECPLLQCKCERHFNLCSFLEHLHKIHNAKKFDDKITIALSAKNTFCYFLFDDQLLVLQIGSADPFSSVEIRHFNLVTNKDAYEISYYYSHSHCKLTTITDVKITDHHCNSGTIISDTKKIKKAECFEKYKNGFSIVIHRIAKL